jgi:PKD repeat protein
MMFCIAVGAYGTGYDVTKSGSLVATDMSNPDLVTIRDNFYPPSGSTQAYPQYVSQHLDNLKIDSIAYVYPTSMTFEGMIFQEGTNATDGGRFYPSVPKVQVFSGGRWMDVSNPTITPPYPLTYNGVNYETYILSFAPAAGTGIRLFGRVINYGTFAEVRAVAVNHAPVVRISASRTTGMRNLDVQFSVDSLYDADGDSVAAGWDFGDGNLSSEANPAHRYTAAGAYRAVFHASDSRGETVSDTILIAVLPNSAPHASIVLPHDSVYYNPADAVTFSGRANDAEQSDSTLQYSWQVILHHNTHTHPNWYTSSQRSFSYSPGIPDQGVIWFEGDLVVSDSGSLADTQRVYLFPGHRPRIAVTSSTDYTFSLQDSLYDINVSALDHDVLDSLSIQILALPSWLTVQRKSPHRWYASGDSALPLWFYDSLTTDWEISGTPGSSHRGDTLVALSILDRTGLSDTLRYPLHVCQTVLKFAPGWNLLSMPHRVPDVLRQAVFPSSTSKAFTYRDGYVTRDSVFFGDGYWLKFDSSQKQGMNGDVVLTDTIPVTKLWNMVGSLSAPVPLNQITSIPGGIIESNAFGYDTAGYYPTTLLQPGAGYWVKAKENGVLILHSSASGFSTGSSRGAPEGMQRLNTLIFEDQRGEKRNLFFKRDLTLEFASQFELPPVPPREVFDVRFATQSNVGAFGSDGPRSMSLPILLQSSSAVLNLSYTINDERRVHYFLTEQARGNVSRKYPLAGTGRLTIDGSGKKVYALVSEDIPGAYMLYQNYPNPYNPATTIRFDLPQSATISIVIMDLLGREVATLVDQKEYPAGYHSVEFNASSLSSGIYFYRLTSGSFSDVRKMALVK